MEIIRMVSTKVKIKIPTGIKANIEYPNTDIDACLLNDLHFDHNCPGIKCEECYFSLGVVKALSDVPPK